MSRRTIGAACAAGLAVLLAVPNDLRADVVVIDASLDNTLYESVAGDLSNALGDHLFTGRTDDADVRRGLIAFDVAAAVPAGATINTVTLTLNVSRERSGTEDVSLHAVLASWGEGTSNAAGEEGGGAPSTPGDATWIHRFYDTDFWSAAGGDYLANASATIPIGNSGFYSWSSPLMAVDVQGWLDDPGSSFGWIVIGNETVNKTAKRFDSRENSDVSRRPKLTIDFTSQNATGACCQGDLCELLTEADCTLAGGVFQGEGTTCFPNPCAATFGACCADSGLCSEVSESQCASDNGAFQGDGSSCSLIECPIVLEPYVDALPIPVTATPVVGQPGGAATYDLTMREFEAQLHRDLPPTRLWGFDDGVTGPLTPGPTIEAASGAPVTVNWINDLRDLDTGLPRTSHFLQVPTDCIHGAENTAKTVVHLHGAHVEAEFDGYPESTFTSGEQDTYIYANNQLPATLWYHDHALGVTRLNVQMGLAGGYLLRDDFEQGLGLPDGEFEIPLVIQDRMFEPGGDYAYPADWQEHFFGDKVLVNGKVWPFLEVKKGKYRFRLLNGSSSRTYTLTLEVDDGSTLDFTVIGNEGGLLPAPVTGISELTFSPGERYDVVVDFAGLPNNTDVFLANSAPAPFPGSPGEGVVPEVMKFRVRNQSGDTDPLPPTLRPIETLDENDAVMSRRFELQKGTTDACGYTPWLINGLHWEDITEYPELGTIEVWEWVNRSGVTHPMHMHLVFFQVLDRQDFVEVDGEIVPVGPRVPPSPEEAGWKDTVQAHPDQITRVIARFEDYKGLYAYHCHILEHEDHEMMRQFQTVLCGDTELDPSEDCDDGGQLDLDGCTAACELEDYLELRGVAEGGRVEVRIDGVVVGVDTVVGQSDATVASALAAAINTDPTLAAFGVVATAYEDAIVTNGTIESVTITDPGLEERVTDCNSNGLPDPIDRAAGVPGPYCEFTPVPNPQPVFGARQHP